MTNHKQKNIWPIIAVVVAALLLLVALPQSKKQWAPSFMRNAHIHFGLDLAGGTQLDFRISEEEMNEQIENLKINIEEAKNMSASGEEIALLEQQLNVVTQQRQYIVESIRTVLERRINALGVSEAVITPSYIGNEKHLLVECPGVVNTQKCINTVGKTITLEFKEEDIEPTGEYEQGIRDKASSAYSRVTESGDILEVIGQDLSDDLEVAYLGNVQYFKNEIPEGINNLWNKNPSDKIYMQEGNLSIPQMNEEGKQVVQEIPGMYLTQITREKTQTGRTLNDAPSAFSLLEEIEDNAKYITYDNGSINDVPNNIANTIQTMTVGSLEVVPNENESASIIFLRYKLEGSEEMEASHIIISYEGATSASEDITRTKKEAKELADELYNRIQEGEDLGELALEYSNGESAQRNGNLGLFARNDMVAEFSNVAFALKEEEISQPIETAFGFHIIRADSTPSKDPDTVAFEELVISGEDAVGKANNILVKLQTGEVKAQEEIAFFHQIFFSFLPTGWKDTQLDGKHFRAATVTLDPTTNIPVVQIMFNDEGAKLFQELTARNIEKRIAIFVGGQLISAPTVQGEIAGGTAIITGMQNFDEAKDLAQNLNTGAIPAPIYLAGQRTVEATLGADALRTSLKAALIGIIILMLYMVAHYRILGIVPSFALSIYALIFFALLKLPLFLFSSQYIVLTLAGMAGIILSIGIAVDANVLIFERIKEELRKGKALSTSVETGFKRAWPSIRDGNVSTFITCIILFLVGTSIIRGFAITLGIGVLLSMFSAIIITRWLVEKVALSPLGKRESFFYRKPNK
ncbi:MAG: protein translocase subunit SecD [Candidatus Peribacteraceae bacterium]|nr:protein translocase subunit SecD [Candidatus Peribacteraceae bacterium]